jgi:hypothetical protein
MTKEEIMAMTPEERKALFEQRDRQIAEKMATEGLTREEAADACNEEAFATWPVFALPSVQFIKGCAQCFRALGREPDTPGFTEFVDHAWRFIQHDEIRRSKRWEAARDGAESKLAALKQRILEAGAA